MKLLTVNVHAWQEDNQMEKIKALAADIAAERYDVIALQEVMQSIAAPLVSGVLKEDNYGLVVLDELKKLGVTGYDIVWAQAHIGYETYEEGLAILTRHSITHHESFFITDSTSMDTWKTRVIVQADIDYNGRPITFFSGHFGWWTDEAEPFERQFNNFLKHVPSDRLAFLMGDLNNPAVARNEGYDLALKSGFYDTYELAAQKDDGLTIEGSIAGWEGNEDGLRIDYILCNQELNVQSSFVRFNGKETPIISDHMGVKAEIIL
ncbi:endonuclease/exonuclease/phosphatase family protein [Fictibacillus aquaticus]|uniref:Endonuclease n=1 Tax=Fictibacillus aquaticus TaxID=2021314 RepID=A0A235F9K9_9BACL|nr:endonuclease/exonuclease/phosphatase family protein [Fictibacillus aquaticus]OYD57764.1 endonuclease [Fictibacillus aquaticus]